MSGELANKWEALSGLAEQDPWPRVDQKHIIELIERSKSAPPEERAAQSAHSPPRKPWWKLW
jgi:hypothetical protein